MIRNQWYAVLESKEVKRKEFTAVKRLGEKLLFFRDSQNEVHCLFDKCSHRGAALSAGQLIGDHVQCPFHGLEFRGDGTCLKIPANGKDAKVEPHYDVLSYTVREEYGFIWIFWGEEKSTFPELPFFDDLDSSFSYSTVQDLWKCHYSRCIENQLDVVHLPFVHKTTIGKGNKTLVNGPKVFVHDDQMNIYVHNAVDTGQIPLKGEDLPEPKPGQQHLHFKFPHTWQNWITDQLRVFIAFVPVDEHFTILYMRFYQKFMRLWGLRHYINWMGNQFNLIIAHQDRRVVETQQPDKSELKMGENLIPGDLPIVRYRKRREELKRGQS